MIAYIAPIPLSSHGWHAPSLHPPSPSWTPEGFCSMTSSACFPRPASSMVIAASRGEEKVAWRGRTHTGGTKQRQYILPSTKGVQSSPCDKQSLLSLLTNSASTSLPLSTPSHFLTHEFPFSTTGVTGLYALIFHIYIELYKT